MLVVIVLEHLTWRKSSYGTQVSEVTLETTVVVVSFLPGKITFVGVDWIANYRKII
jgi:hypothetical protein